MKAEDIFGNKNGQNGELTHKLRSVSDLIRHIKTKEESSPANYSIFLGAGASVTSGIRTGSQLIDEWAIELYERFNQEKPINSSAAKEYFEKSHPSWYNSDNPYSSLFEKKFDLPTQRRRFVEQEVSNKLPSIGYSYLTSLVDENYFNTIFTTNFDDLINEAFYVFSNKRPIVCAHDSSIRSVSITSKRPKIVKLHGDYLFDDIKSTLRETESLEQNTKEKFVEFCKEYGLIVVGYSGCDRSIMDVLEFLVKQETYLKNGIYWCLRPGDEVCHNLRNLIWKDKVYPVLINGFDELFAEIHNHTISKELNLNSSTKQSKLEMTIRQIVEDNYNLGRNEIIGKEITAIRDEDDSKDISEFIKQLSLTNESTRLGTKDFRNLLEIESLTESRDFTRALALCDLHFQNAKNNVEKKIYIEKYIGIHTLLDDSKNVTYWCEKLLELDPNNITYHLKKINAIKKTPDQIKLYTDLVERFPYSNSVRNSAATALIRTIRQKTGTLEVEGKLAIEYLEKSLLLDPSLDNAAWEKLLDVLYLQHHRTKDAEAKKTIKQDISEFIKTARTRNPEHQQTLELLEQQLDVSCTANELVGLLDFYGGLSEKFSLSRRKHLGIVTAKALDHIYRMEDNSELKLKITQFFESYIAEPHPPITICLAKIRYLHTIAKKTAEAQTELDSLISRKKLGIHISDILELPTEFTRETLTLLKSKLDFEKHNLNSLYYAETAAELCLALGDFDSSLIQLENAYAEGLSFTSYLARRSYALLCAGNPKEVIEMSSQYNDLPEDDQSEAFQINMQTAAKLLNHRLYNPVTLRNLSAQSDDDEVKICAFSLLGQPIDARRLITKRLEMDPGLIKKYKQWPALSADCLPESGASNAEVA